MPQEFGITFGALAPEIKEQLDEAGLVYDEKDADHFNRDAEAITRLFLRDLIPNGQAEKARQKLVKKIGEAVAPAEEGGSQA